MKKLIIYDNEGFVVQEIGGTYRLPIGLPYLEIEVPSNKFVSSVDVTVIPHQAIFVDLPKTDTEILHEELENTKLALAELAEITLGGTV